MITKSWLSQCWQWQIGGCVAIVGVLCVGVSDRVLAQIVPDNTLPSNSLVTPGCTDCTIDGGTTAGSNLFHSFTEFSVPTGGSAVFNNALNIQNIFSRVTGGAISNIDGLIGANGTANLFLINPSGIVFGENASLNVQGSFVATTANAIQFDNGEVFSATNPSAPPILAINPSAFFFNQVPAGAITNRSTAGLQVPDGQTLGLIGGDVRLEGGRLTAAGGRIELGSVAGVGQVSLSQTGNRFVLGYDSVSGFGNITLSDRASVDASGEGGGDVQIRGTQLEMRQDSNIWANTEGAENGGQLTVIATDRIEVSDSSSITARVNPNAKGNGGDVTIQTQDLRIIDGANLSASTFGEGDAGNLSVTATERIELSGTDSQGNPSSITAQVNSNAKGDGGNLTLETAQLSVSQGGFIAVSTFGTGDGGELNVNATQIELIGTDPINGSPSGLFARVEDNATGNGGDVTIQTQGLRIIDGASLSASTSGEGDAGDLSVTATERIEVTGSDPEGKSSGIRAQVNLGATGDGGNLTLETGELSLSQGGQIAVSTFGTGDGGELNVNVTQIELIGTDPINGSPSGLFARVEANATGNGGDVTIQTQGLRIIDGASLSASTSGEGDAGNLSVMATERIEVTGSDPEGNSSGITAQVNLGATGDGGNINITAGSASVTGGAQILARNNGGQGNAGSVTIHATDMVTIAGFEGNGDAIVGSDVANGGIGNGNDVNITARSVFITDEAIVAASIINGTGENGNPAQAGNVNITASDTVSVSNSRVFSEVGSTSVGNGGTINIHALNVVLENGASLITQIRPGGEGSGGDINITTGSLSVTGGSQLFASTRGRGNAGNITIKASDTVSFDGVGSNPYGRNVFIGDDIYRSAAYSTVEEGAEGDGGDINITAPSVTLSGNGQLSVETRGDGVAGNLTIDTGRLTVRDGATISASTSSPNPSRIGGNIEVTATQSLDLNQASLLAQSTGAAPAGNVEINTGNLTARDGTIATSSERSSGGGITITADQMRLWGDSDITTNVNEGTGGGGNIYLEADSILAFDDSDILAFAENGTGGDINLDTPAFFGENYRPAPRNTNPDTLDLNNQVDVNADSNINPGTITRPDTTFIQNSLTELPENQIDTDSLLANSCIVRRNQPTEGSFTITGSGGLPQRPGDAQMSSFPTVDIETLPSDSPSSTTNPNRPWQKGDPIVEPQGVYRLPNGQLVMSRECPQ